ncbi:sigma-54 interaction domain-containing protein [Planctomycetota bacterium]
MEKFQSVLLNVWREACRHIEIAESAATIVSMLKRDLPIEQLSVRGIDRKRSCIETVAETMPGGEHIEPWPRKDCLKNEMKRVIAWCRKGDVSHCRAGTRRQGPMRVVVPDGIERDIIAGPLWGSEDSYGALVLMAGPKQAFNRRHVTLLKTLLDPFSVALKNDLQLKEMAILREAAEADKRSLLARLGRERLGDTIVGSQSGLNEVMERVQLVGRSDAPVLIFGETGSGKELIARAIHSRSPRADRPFIRVNCGAIPSELIDTQLFGHEEGAFTGAASVRKGWFERADGGSLLLDEVAELSPAAQVRLLRILQDGWLERVGSQESIHVDVRIVAATHRDLAAMVAEGTFREDLWYRIAVFPIVLPPLRHRREDIPELARHFAKRAATRFGLPETMPTDEDIALMISYDWPGNVREVAAVMDRAAILGNGVRLEVAGALGLTGIPFSSVTPDPREQPAETKRSTEIMSLENVLKHHIEVTLRKTGGRVEGPNGAAGLLQINPNTLRAKMQKLKIDWRQFRR